MGVAAIVAGCPTLTSTQYKSCLLQESDCIIECAFRGVTSIDGVSITIDRVLYTWNDEAQGILIKVPCVAHRRFHENRVPFFSQN